MEKSWNCVFEFLWEPCILDDFEFTIFDYIISADGRVIKAINKGIDGNIESVVIEDIQVLDKSEPVKELRIFDETGQGKLIVVSKRNIVSIPLHRCEKQTTCG